MPSIFAIPCRAISRKTIVALLGLLTVMVAAHAPEPAHAGTYKMYTCSVPGRATSVPTKGPWTWELDNLNTGAYDNCAAGGTFGITLNPGQRFMRQSSSAWLLLRRPSDGPFSRIGIVRYRTWLIAQLSGFGAPAFIHDGGGFGAPGFAHTDAEPWVSPLMPETNPAVGIRLFCSAGAPADCFFNSEAPLLARGIEVDLYEETPPSAVIAGGSLLNGAPHDRTETITYSAVDQESGVARVEALAGDTVIGRQDLEADSTWCPHTGFNACRGTRNSDMIVDTTGAPSGRRVVSLRVTDAAGNRTVVTGPTIDLKEQRAPSAVRLTAHFAKSTSLAYTSSFGQGAAVTGRLTDTGGRGIADADILVSERIALPGARDTGARRVRTRRDGSFRYIVSRRASSRTIRVRYDGVYLGRKVAAARTLRLQVRASARLAVALHGTLVRYSGRVIAAPLPEEGKRVNIQGRVKGGVWQTFARRRTTRRGQFVGTYRLRVHRPGVRLEFRVRVPREKRYPFVTGVGRVVARTVR